ncbi:hypothetical protein D9M70_635390 [compost metagenome]
MGEKSQEAGRGEGANGLQIIAGRVNIFHQEKELQEFEPFKLPFGVQAKPERCHQEAYLPAVLYFQGFRRADGVAGTFQNGGYFFALFSFPAEDTDIRKPVSV